MTTKIQKTHGNLLLCATRPTGFWGWSEELLFTNNSGWKLYTHR